MCLLSTKINVSLYMHFNKTEKSKITVNENDQEMPQLHTADQSTAHAGVGSRPL